VTCCIPESAEGAFTEEDPEVECERTSEHECADEGGMVVQADSCEPDPCAPAPPAHTVVCCVPEDGETECEVLTEEHCTAEHGTVSDATSCDTHTCGGGDGGGGDDGGGDDSGHDGGEH
jgi:hypothetical protein